MRFLLSFLITFTMLATSTTFAQVAANSSDVFTKGNVPRNYVKNPFALVNKNNVTVSSATIARDTTKKLDGVASFACDTSALNGYCLWDTATVLAPDDKGTCEVSAWYQGDASLYSFQAFDGTNVVVSSPLINAGTEWQRASMVIPCGATLKPRLTQTTAGTSGAVNIGRLYSGRTTRVGSASVIQGWKDYTVNLIGTGSNPTKGGVIKDKAIYRVVGDVLEIRYDYLQGSPGSSGTGRYLIPLPPGFSADLTKITPAVNDGITPTVGRGTLNTSTGGTQNFSFTMEDATTVMGYAPAPFDKAFGSDANGFLGGLGIAVVEFSMQLFIPIVAPANQSIVLPDAQGWYIDANIRGTSGGHANLGTSNVGVYTEISDGTRFTMTRNAGSAAVGIACVTGNSSIVGNLTCASGYESIGATFNVPVSGTYETCFDFAHYGDITAGNINAVFAAAKTTSSSSAVLEDGSSRLNSYFNGTQGSIRPTTICTINKLSAGQNTFRLQYLQNTSGTITANLLIADGSLGGRDIHVKVKSLTEQTSAILANSVSTGNANGLKIEAISFEGAGGADSSCTTVPCGGVRLTTPGWATITRSNTGLYSLDWTGKFSSIPHCTCTVWQGAADSAQCSIQQVNKDTAGIYIYNRTGSGFVDARGTVMCIGDR